MAISIPQLSLFDAIRHEQQQSLKFNKNFRNFKMAQQPYNGPLNKNSCCTKIGYTCPKILHIFKLFWQPCIIKGTKGIKRHCIALPWDFHWTRMKNQVKDFVHSCSSCQHHSTTSPSQIWTDIALDFMEGYPTSRSKNVILVVFKICPLYSICPYIYSCKCRSPILWLHFQVAWAAGNNG